MTLDMMALEKAHPILEALGWALLHFVWQGAVLALLLFAFQKLARQAPATVHYAASCVAMLLMVAAFAGTVFHYYPAVTPVIRNPLIAAVPLSPPKVKDATFAATPSLPMPGLPTGPPDWIAGVWLSGVFALSIGTLGGWTRAQSLRWNGLQPVDEAWLGALESLKRRLGVSQTVRLCVSAMAQVPAVVGWARPCILLPLTALTGLSESHLRAILAHELEHIRRHDDLVNLLQTAVETLLFYHPAVWWVGRQIRQEREHCCDDIAVAVCGDPIEYASALTDLEEIRGRIPEPALAANGGDLLRRVRRLLGERDRDSRPLGALVAAALAMFLAVTPALLSQQPAFEVASVKPNHGGDPNRLIRPSGGGVSISNMNLQDLMMFAYQVRDFQISGGPRWLNADQFDIEAKAPGGTSQDQTRLMLQSLLADRFKLTLHREIKELPIFNLTVAKGGLKVQPLKEGSCIEMDRNKPAPPAPGKTRMDYCGNQGIGRGTVEAANATMPELAVLLSGTVHRTVVDKTGIAGQFRIQMTFVPDETAPSQLLTSNPGAPPSASDGPSIYTAVQEQLGLKLDSAKGPVEVLVIDHAETPSEN